MKKLNIALLGLGTLGSSFLSILRQEGESIKERSHLELNVLGVYDRSANKKKDILLDIPAIKDIDQLISNPDVDVVLELMGGVDFPLLSLKKAFEHGKAVVTANKALLAIHGNEIFPLAEEKGLELGFEAAVGGSMPIIQNFRRGLIIEQVRNIYGILNGTSNFILSKMLELKISYDEALEKAQKNGFAEANPEFDVGGIDATQKLSILTALAYDVSIQPQNIQTKGIENIQVIDLEFADSLGYIVRPIALARKREKNDALELSVCPSMIPKSHILASVKNAMNALLVEGTYTEKIAFIGPGAGGKATTASIISDLIFIGRKVKFSTEDQGQKIKVQTENWLTRKNTLSLDKDPYIAYYLRLSAQDKTGVLADILMILAYHNISIASLHQYERKPEKKKLEPVDIIILTHKASSKNLEKALVKINKLEIIISPVASIRIEENF